MFKKLSNDTAHFNIFADALDPRHKAANTSDDEPDLNARLRCFIQQTNDLGVDQRIDLCGDPRRQACFCVVDLVFDHLNKKAAKPCGRDLHFMINRRRGIARDDVKE